MKDNGKVLSFPELVTYSFEYQKEHFWRCRYTSSESTSLYYKILLPLDVKPVGVKPELIAGTNNLYAIGCYQTVTGTKYPFIEIDVAYEQVNNDIDASEWGEYILSLLDEEILHRKDYYSASGRYADFLSKSCIDGKTVISRVRVFKNYDFEHKGANMIIVKASSSEEDYELLAEDLYHCVKFFTLINDSKWHLAEELKSINLDLPASYSFYYPASWLYSERYNNEKMSYYSLSLRGETRVHGVIDGYFLHYDATINKDQIYDLIISNIEAVSYNYIKETFSKQVGEIFNKNITELWKGEFNVKNSEGREGLLIIFVGKVQGCWFFIIGSLTSREQSFASWAAGKRAIDIILNSLNNYDLEYEDQFYHDKR
ncbi:hypothetical protein JJP69_06085 [Enterobacter cloacae]|uniref:hypothetical protein n=3 Tax=Enterobacter TaxID=547 RepID=UPI0013002794|nr:hypothetical protein [Enterobacter cloacae complex sp.]MBJ6386874.1 hypothetical protein [Enterobacter cloacae]MBJ6405610.1 hypothetical protein [Enterobacter cloacae]MBJ6496417.1 hypothetical protein [Enterobacter cloacae]MBJ6575127.1 hypothetical protein [Enterobacter cloacae]MBK4221763.1 hypothetical protein [Enterobacter cloacae]